MTNLRYQYLNLILCLIIFTCNSLISGVIKVKVVQANDLAPLMSHLQLINLKDSVSKKIVEESIRGEFTININRTGIYGLRISAVNHMPNEFLFNISNPTDSIFIKVKLKANEINNDTLYILGNFNNFRYDKNNIMEKDSNGQFTFKLDSKIDTLIYQVFIKIQSYNRSFNGTISDSYKIDNGGDYYSIIYSKEKNYLIKFNPLLLPNNLSQDSLPNVEFVNSSDNSTFFNVQEKIRSFKEEIFTKKNSKLNGIEDKKSRINSFKDKLNSIIHKIEGIFNSTSNESIKSYLAVEIINYYTIGFLFDKINILGIKILPLESNKDFIKNTLKFVEISDPLREYLSWEDGYIFTTSLICCDDEENNTIFKEFLEKYPNNKFKKKELEKAIYYYEIDDPNEDLQRYYTGYYVTLFPDDILSYHFKNKLKSEIKIGKKIPNFKVESINGNVNFTKDTLIGKYTLIDFWSTKCGPCIKEIPNLTLAKEKYHNLLILSISFDSKNEDVINFQKNRYKMDWINAIERESFKSELAKDFSVFGIPKILLIGPNLEILAIDSQLRGNRLFETLEKYMLGK